MNAQLESLFDSLKSEADVQQLVRDKREEDLYLEFKQKADRRHANIDDSDRSGFSQTLSGFANADGGILVFGVATKKSPDNPDRASALKPVTNPDRFRAKLLDSILNSTQPPHRAMHAQREYWRRTSNGHRRMDHYELEDVFGRRLRPVLRIGVELHARADPDPREELSFAFLNEGRGVARHAGFICTLGQGKVVGAYGGLNDVSSLNEQRPMVSFYDAQSVVHANGLFSVLGRAILERPAKGSPLPITIKWYAENMAPREQSAEVEPGKLRLF